MDSIFSFVEEPESLIKVSLSPTEQWKPLNPEEKKKYDREFLLGFQFISASMNKPEGLPQISDVVLDKVAEARTHTHTHTHTHLMQWHGFLSLQANKTPLRQLDPSRLPGMNCGPDFTPSFANLGRPSAGGRGPVSYHGTLSSLLCWYFTNIFY